LTAIAIFGLLETINGVASAQVIAGKTSIGDSSLTGTSGHVAINQAAGIGNQEMNTVSLSNTAAGTLTINQKLQGNFAPTDNGSATLGNYALAGASGIVQLSQTSGNGNIAANAAFIGVGPESGAMSPISLSQMRTGFAPPDPNAVPYTGHTSISPTAFAGASGVVQVDQTAGDNNVGANLFSLRVGAGAAH
jgi:hypothetical protein